mgnify:CR=1 FL=1
MPTEHFPFQRLRTGGDLPVLEIRIGVSRTEIETLREVGIPIEVPPPREQAALVDTGAMRTFIPRQVVDQLGLIPRGQVPVAQPLSQTVQVFLYDVSIELFIRKKNAAGWTTVGLVPLVQAGLLPDRGSGARQFPMPIIGRDVLSHCRFVYNGPESRIELFHPRRSSGGFLRRR